MSDGWEVSGGDSEQNARLIAEAVLSENGIKGIAGVAVANQIIDSLAEVHLIASEASGPVHKATDTLGPIRSLCQPGWYQIAERWENVTCERCLAIAAVRLQQILVMCDEWDAITKGETPATTKPIRDIALGREGTT